jgi:hypothetical protein
MDYEVVFNIFPGGVARPRGMRAGHHILDRLPRTKYDPRKKPGVNGGPLARANQGSSRTGSRRAGQCHSETCAAAHAARNQDAT